jgi:hypothetical protein
VTNTGVAIQYGQVVGHAVDVPTTVNLAKDTLSRQLKNTVYTDPTPIYIYALVGVVSAQRPELPPLVPTYREIK